MAANDEKATTASMVEISEVQPGTPMLVVIGPTRVGKGTLTEPKILLLTGQDGVGIDHLKNNILAETNENDRDNVQFQTLDLDAANDKKAITALLSAAHSNATQFYPVVFVVRSLSNVMVEHARTMKALFGPVIFAVLGDKKLLASAKEELDGFGPLAVVRLTDYHGDESPKRDQYVADVRALVSYLTTCPSQAVNFEEAKTRFPGELVRDNERVDEKEEIVDEWRRYEREETEVKTVQEVRRVIRGIPVKCGRRRLFHGRKVVWKEVEVDEIHSVQRSFPVRRTYQVREKRRVTYRRKMTDLYKVVGTMRVYLGTEATDFQRVKTEVIETGAPQRL